MKKRKPVDWVERLRINRSSPAGTPYENQTAYHQRLIHEQGFEAYLKKKLWMVGESRFYFDHITGEIAESDVFTWAEHRGMDSVG